MGKRQKKGCPILHINETVILKTRVLKLKKQLELRKKLLAPPTKKPTNLINEDVFSTYLWKHFKNKFKHYPFWKNKQDLKYKLKLHFQKRII